MKRKALIIYCAFCIMAFFSGVFAGIFVNRRQEEPRQITAQETGDQFVYREEQATTSPEPEPTFLPSKQFLLNLAGDSIAVYQIKSGGETELLFKKNVNVSALRQEDYENLCSGIFVDSEVEAREMVEDFIS